MPKRTKIVCLHEGQTNDSTDAVFANAFIKKLKPTWKRDLRFVPCGGKTNLLNQLPIELKICGRQGGDTTLIVLADVDDDCENSDALKQKYHTESKACGISDDLFNSVIFIFPKDRIENWIEFIMNGTTDEYNEGPRVKNDDAKKAARKLVRCCNSGRKNECDNFPPSLQWSCRNWKALVARMNP